MPPGTSISPELALVDPELRADALAALPEPPDCLVLAPLAHATPAAPAEPRWRRLPRQAATGAVWATLLLIPASSLLAFLPSSSVAGPSFVLAEQPSAEQPSAEQPSAEPSRPAARPEARPVARPAPDASADPAAPSTPTAPAREAAVLAWPAVQGAQVYNVIFVRGQERIDTWTRTNRLALGRADGPAAGEAYSWFAYPGTVEGGRVSYGKVAGHGTVRVRAAAIPRGSPPAGG